MDEIYEFKINRYISLKLEDNRTVIYVNGKKFLQCKYLLIKNPQKYFYEDFDSIDDISDFLDRKLEKKLSIEAVGLTPEEEFLGHCSNIQAWCLNGYDTKILHSNLSFPLLKALVDSGDQKATSSFKEEIAKRFLSKNLNVIRYLIEEGYLKYLDKSEIDVILSNFLSDLNDYEISILNKIEEEVGEKFFNEISNTSSLKKMYYITLKSCTKEINLSGLGIKRIPLSLFDLKSLRSLDLYCNRLQSLPSQIGKLESLMRLNLFYNRIKKLPKDIKNLKNLKFLHLGSNLLTKVPYSIGHLEELETFQAFDNKIADIPASIGDLTSLRELNLDANKITEIPDSIGELTSLETLSLVGNNIKEVPSTLSDLTHIKIINLRNNKLDKNQIAKMRKKMGNTRINPLQPIK